MRTTVRLDAQLLREVRKLAAESGRTLTAVIEDALRQSLERSRKKRSSERLPMPTFGGHGLRPGVNLDNSAELLDLMEGRQDPPLE